MNKTFASTPRRQPLTRKRIAVAITLLPVTLPFTLLHRLVEWWHFCVSQSLIQLLRAAAKRRDSFFSSLDERHQAGGSSLVNDPK